MAMELWIGEEFSREIWLWHVFLVRFVSMMLEGSMDPITRLIDRVRQVLYLVSQQEEGVIILCKVEILELFKSYQALFIVLSLR